MIGIGLLRAAVPRRRLGWAGPTGHLVVGVNGLYTSGTVQRSPRPWIWPPGHYASWARRSAPRPRSHGTDPNCRSVLRCYLALRREKEHRVGDHVACVPRAGGAWARAGRRDA